MAVITQAQAVTFANAIKTETVANANTATRVGQLFLDLAQSLAFAAFVASGASHAGGLVPDPGAVAGTTKFLCEDATWKVPSSAFSAPATPADDNKLAYANAGSNGWRAGITTPGANRLAFAQETTNSNLQFEHNTIVARVKDSTGAGYTTLLRYGVTGNDELCYGGGGATDATAHIWRTRDNGSFSWQVTTGVNVGALTKAGFALSGTVISAAGTTVASALRVTDAAHTGLQASTERNSVVFDMGQTRTWNAGALATQRSLRVIGPTIAFGGASVLTLAATLAISAAPIAGTNATITSTAALLIESGGIAFGTGDLPSGATGLLMVGAAAAASPKVILQGRVAAGGTSVSLLRLGSDGDNVFTVGENTNLATVNVKALTQIDNYIGGNVRTSLTATAYDIKTSYVAMSSQSAPSAPGSTDLRLFNEGGFLKTISALRTVVLDFPTITKGTDLTDANQTLSPTKGTRYVQPPILTTGRTKTVDVAGSPAQYDCVWFENEDNTNALTINNGGPAGGVAISIPANTAGCIVFDGANWIPGVKYGIA
jgi:hypothetical protein